MDVLGEPAELGAGRGEVAARCQQGREERRGAVSVPDKFRVEARHGEG